MAEPETKVEETIETTEPETTTKKGKKNIKNTAVEPAVPYDPWKDMVTINLPIPRDEDAENFVIVGVNGRTYKIMRNGEDVQIPRPVYEVFRNAEDQKDAAARKRAELRAKAKFN